MEFAKRNFEMCQNLIKTLVERGELNTETEALQCIQDKFWLSRHGYGHIAHVLSSQVGIDACQSVFARQKDNVGLY